MKPLAIDLCCGRGGWTKGLQAAGFEVIGFDTLRDPLYPGSLVLQDVRTLDGSRFRGHALFFVASPPCQEFSFRDLPFGRSKNLPPPDTSIAEACFRIADEADAPLVLENVRGAQKFLGRAKWHFGPYYLWGSVPALLPISDRSAQKGLTLNRGECKGPRRYHSKSSKRKNWTAEASMIPFELAYFIGQVYFDSFL